MVVQYKCPSCGADMAFDSTTGTLHCHSCGRSDRIEEMPAPAGAEDAAPAFDTATGSEEAVHQYHCQNCGAVLLTDADTVATTCSFCGAGVILGDRLTGQLMPAKVIPFALSQPQAQETFRTWCKARKLAPKGLVSGNRIKSITGLYVPFWLYDVNGIGSADAECTKVRSYSDGDYDCTETEYYDVHREVDVTYLKIPVDASAKMDDADMDKLEPYHYEDLKSFKMPYLAGYLAEKYDQDDKELFPRVQSRAEGYVAEYIDAAIKGYATTSYRQKEINIHEKQAEYVLFPVWMIHYDYNHKVYTFSINGQTGKIIGKPPFCKKRIARWFTGITAASFAVLKVIAMMLGGYFL